MILFSRTALIDPEIQLSAQRLSTRFSFFGLGFATAAWAPLIPFAQQRLHFNHADFGLLLLCGGLGAMLAMPATGKIVQRIGCRVPIGFALLLLAVLLPSLSLLNTPLMMAITLFLFGTAGGLAVAIQDALDDIGGIWLGWNGERVHKQEEVHFNILRKDKVEYVTCPLTNSQYSDYYAGFANNSLWPAMHYRSDLIEFKTSEYEGYQKVNSLFAQKLAEIADPDDTIWVHDYHFLSVAKYCRELGMQNKIGFFLHIPFAPLFIWQKIPCAQQLIEDLCQYDVVGLQTDKDQKVCMQVCTSLLNAQKIQQTLLSYHQRLTIIKCYPIGVNPTAIQKAAHKFIDVQDFLTRPVELNAAKTIIGVDRIDYSKGLLERFLSYAEFLEKYPEYQQHIQHLQIACPCRLEVPAYQRLFERFKIKIEMINQEFAQEEWQPVECIYDAIKHHHLMQIYRQADVCWISSIRDGMNLVAKEYIAAQNPSNPGVLILSKYAGAAEHMSEALLVDPTDKMAMVNALKKALEMPRHERISRYKQLMKGLKNFDINDWRNAFLNDLQNKTAMQDFRFLGMRNVNPIYQNL